MSFVLTVWQQPAALALPRDVDEAQAQLEQVRAQRARGPQPVFAAFVRALLARFPADDADDGDDVAVYDASLAGLEQGPCEPYYNLGLWTRAEAFDAAYAHAVVQANDRGLHVMDEQNGLAFLANGQALALGRPQHGLRAYDALLRGDHAAAWAEYRRLAPLRDPQSLRDWGFMICNGQACRRHMALGAAVAELSGVDPAGDPELARCLSRVLASQRPLQAQLLAGLRTATDLVAFVDAELARDPAGPRADPATLEAAQALGISSQIVTQAATGDRVAQRRLGQELLWHKGTATRSLAQLAARWLERAAGQGEPSAQAMLGGALLRGYREMPIDMARGMALLEQAVAVDHPLGLNYLQDYLHHKSVRAGRRPGTQEQRTDADSVRNLGRVLELCTRWAAGGHALGVFTLAVRLYDGVGAPRDEVAAKAVMQLIKRPTPGLEQAQVEPIRREQAQVLAMMEPTREDAHEVFNLARELAADLRRLPELLAKRRAAALEAMPMPAASRGSARAASPPEPEPPAIRRAPVSTRDRDATPEPGRRWHLGHLGLVLGLAGFLLLMMLAPSLGTAGLRTLAAATGAAGAYGVWRCGGDLDWATGKRALLSLLALVPMAGFVVCVAVGLQVLRRP